MITRFEGQYAYLSNFDMFPVEIRGVMWKGVEVWFQFAKKLHPSATITEEALRYSVRDSNTGNMIQTTWPDLGPKAAKQAGRRLTLPSDWEEVKENYMLEGLREKFTQIEKYRVGLITTYPAELVEGNYWHDNHWGVCTCNSCKAKHATGKNRLGALLQTVREELMESRLR